MTCKIKSSKGFYIGDICYALSDSIYNGVWGSADYESGKFDVNKLSFAVALTDDGDGCYCDNSYRFYDLDAGNIGIFPLELVSRKTTGGHVFDGGGTAEFTFEDGVIEIVLPSGEDIVIFTYDDSDDEENVTCDDE